MICNKYVLKFKEYLIKPFCIRTFGARNLECLDAYDCKMIKVKDF